MRKFVTNAFIALGAVALMASCAKSTDLFDQSAVDAQKKAEMLQEIEQTKINYEANFVKKYGAIDPNQSWDFAAPLHLGTRSGGEGDVTDITTDETITTVTVAGLDFDIKNGEVTKNKSLYDGINTKLPEKTATSGEPIKLLAPETSFYIYPVSTRGEWIYDLKIRIGENNDPITLFSKNWTGWDKHYVNGMVSDNKTINMGGIKIKAKPGTPIDIFIDNVDYKGARRASVGSFNGQAIYVDVPEGTTIDTGFELKKDAKIKYIGIEDNDGSVEASDNDFNDIVLAVVGDPDIPGKTVITHDYYDVPTYKAKRYMVEDLGGDDDFDFNDIVVDVHQNITAHHKLTFVDGVQVKDEIIKTDYSDQVAEIRAMGGTLDFDLTIGKTTWSKSKAGFNVGTMYNTQEGYEYSKVLATFTIEENSWDFDNNNISVTIKKTGAFSGNITYEIPFPKEGSVPMIVAVNADSDWTWMTERIGVPESWIKK
jgi:hypothetical protein